MPINNHRVGIIDTGWIAKKMALTLGQMKAYDDMKQGLLESPYMPHCETLRMMHIIPELRIGGCFF
ncbi:hypothetical protein [Bacteroides heparinolyticus]|uniref:hypothetical protein n=1 Tax=Prevotella heparinolytica TaxID=28113 RepID=UPI0035A17606